LTQSAAEAPIIARLAVAGILALVLLELL